MERFGLNTSNNKDELIIKHSCMLSGKENAMPILSNHYNLAVSYESGISQKCALGMYINVYNDEGSEFLCGVVPKDHVLMSVLEYEKKDGVYVTKSKLFWKAKDLEPHFDGATCDESSAEFLSEPVDFPFPLEDRIEKVMGEYRIPVLGNDREKSYISFSEKYK